ncbi:MAG: hypothetical protein FGM55_08825 [Rhodoferax sp.]|nr:hypothetical protein [Rhodoferax sp.]
MADYQYEYSRQRNRVVSRRRQVLTWVGLVILFSGYVLLAVSPDTPSDWVLIRVFSGFVALFVGFGLAVVPILTRVTGGDD